ncbi:MAG: triose-phosphate isomerase [Pseudomonadota bacterium]
MLIGTSWKMNHTRASAKAYVDRLAALCRDDPPNCTLFLCPPFTAIETVRTALDAHGLDILLGAQNCHAASEGAFTGEVSAAMVKEAGCTLVELGHSERRRDFCETDGVIAAKVKAVAAEGLRPLLCVGEDRSDRTAGAAIETVLRQAKRALHGLEGPALNGAIIAYEPVWAIGVDGTAATPNDIGGVVAALKAAFPLPVLYGGSVDDTNAAAFITDGGVDGLFVGRAALTADGLMGVARNALAAR